VASRRLKYPLDGNAVKTANREFWAKHPELDGQRLSPDSSVELRREWVNAYIAAGGALDVEPKAPPAEVSAPCATPPFDCGASWGDAEAAADQVINKSADPIERNKHINAAYAKMYLEDPKLEWLGAAAFASKQVGCGIKDAKRYKDIAEVDRQSWNPDGPNPIIQLQGGYAEPVYDSLANGNKAVFKDIYPAHVFYKKHGFDKLKQCGTARQPPLDKKVLDGFADIEAGHSATGAMKILQHEQMDILQARDVFGNQAMVDAMKMNQWASQHWYGRMFGAQPTQVAFTPACKGEPSVTFGGDNPADPAQRWPYAQEVVNKFDQIKSEPQTIDGLKALANAR
jgi:hypothetical protein